MLCSIRILPDEEPDFHDFQTEPSDASSEGSHPSVKDVIIEMERTATDEDPLINESTLTATGKIIIIVY